ncbi:GNAT family N-acetyltransferase [Kitasatospora camelliae]|uniref:GNAT family N-acetyltransferase n=1 Tax=Kitasatospora camelliae TaxID=3156397 RepID=A0AAU8K776_9ACTN
MSSFTPLADRSDWYPAFRQRHLDSYRATGVPAAAAELLVDQLLDPAQDWTAVAVTDGNGRRIGQAVVGVIDPQGRSIGRIVDLWTDPAEDPTGDHHRAARAWAQAWCTEHAARRVAVRLAEPHPSFAGYPVRSQTRYKALASPTAAAAGRADGVTTRPMTGAEYPAWVAGEQESYIADIVRSGTKTAEEARKQAEQEFLELLPDGPATADTAILVIEADGAQVGVVWLRHGYLPGVSYLYTVAVHPEHRGRGFGRAAMAVADETSAAAGDLGLMFNVFGGNDVAMNLYTSAGYLVLEESRSIDLAPANGRE